MRLLDVQLAALKACGNNRSFAYFMEQGLGKTLTSQADLLERVKEGNVTRSVVVAPNSFKTGWVREAEKWGLPINQFVWDSSSNYHEHWARRPSDKVRQLIVNYEAIRQERVQRFIKDWVSGHRPMVIWDESIQLKTHNSAQTVAAIELGKHFDYGRLLSGKPIVTGPHDLWGQYRAIRELDGRNFFAFRNLFCRMGGFKGKQIIGAQNEDFLASLIDPFTFRASKADWTDLPPKMYTIRNYELNAELQHYYDQMLNEFVIWLDENENVAVDQAITKYIKLAQIQTGWIYDEEGNVRQLVSDDKNPRLKLLLRTIEDEVTGKVAIAYHHKPVLDQLLRNLGGEERCAWIKGGMEGAAVERQKDRFNNDPRVRFILLQTRASKYGHTLLGSDDAGRCYTMVIYENTYSLDDRSQIEDRIHRHGQTADSVLYLDLVGTPLDQDCVEALQRRESIFQAVISRLRRTQRP